MILLELIVFHGKQVKEINSRQPSGKQTTKPNCNVPLTAQQSILGVTISSSSFSYTALLDQQQKEEKRGWKRKRKKPEGKGEREAEKKNKNKKNKREEEEKVALTSSGGRSRFQTIRAECCGRRIGGMQWQWSCTLQCSIVDWSLAVTQRRCWFGLSGWLCPLICLFTSVLSFHLSIHPSIRSFIHPSIVSFMWLALHCVVVLNCVTFSRVGHNWILRDVSTVIYLFIFLCACLFDRVFLFGLVHPQSECNVGEEEFRPAEFLNAELNCHVNIHLAEANSISHNSKWEIDRYLNR